MRRGRAECNSGSGLHPLYVNVEMGTGNTATNWIDSLQAAFPGVQVLHGDLEEAICHHALYYSIWKKYGCLPERRHEETGLVGNVLDVHTGEWMGKVSGLGAGVDSYYEILLKSFIMFGEPQDAEMFHVSYDKIKQYMRRGRAECNSGSGLHPLYVNVEMGTGNTATNWIDSLQAAFPGVQVLHGDLQEAICHHAL